MNHHRTTSPLERVTECVTLEEGAVLSYFSRIHRRMRRETAEVTNLSYFAANDRILAVEQRLWPDSAWSSLS
jgi:hypothetical protein